MRIITSSTGTKKNHVEGIELQSGEIVLSDIVISNADMWHTETQLLQPNEQTYPESYWEKKTLAPSAYILYLGVD